ncbi:MAG: hypothetical protein ACYC7J_10540 [Syntrophales bacterium]
MDTKSKTPVKKSLFTILVIVLVIILGLVAYIYLGRDWSGVRPGEKEKTAEIRGPAVTVPPGTRAPDAGTMPAAVSPCTENREKLQGLFAYLDRQEYVASHKLTGGAFEHFKGLLARLLERPPFIVRETDDLVWVLQNKAHFFRVLGKKNTLLLRDIIRKEGDMMESSFAILYQAMVLQEQCASEGPAVQAPLKDVYPYAVYFLDTLGGSSYLIRRDSRVRMLTQYYSLLVLDEANRRRLNRLGLDIRPPLDALIGDLQGAANLTRKEEYIRTLKGIRAKY